MTLRKVYHWSPTINREAILKEGLRIMMSEIEYENPMTGAAETWKPPYLCTSPSPLLALRYVLPMFERSEAELPSLDLFEVLLTETDQIRLRNDGGPSIIEVRILNSVEAGRVRYVATRTEG